MFNQSNNEWQLLKTEKVSAEEHNVFFLPCKLQFEISTVVYREVCVS